MKEKVLAIFLLAAISLISINRYVSLFDGSFDFGQALLKHSFYDSNDINGTEYYDKHFNDINGTEFHEDYIRGIRAVVNQSSIIEWNAVNFLKFSDFFDHDDVDHHDKFLTVWSDESRFFVHTMTGLCSISQQFKESGSIKRHILLANLNENWGALSSPVPNRTVDWGTLESHWKREGCTKEDILEYLDHERTLAVFTTQHQAFDHPKVYSIPLGIGSSNLILDQMATISAEERSELLMVNVHEEGNRKSQVAMVLKAFHEAGYSLNNTYNMDKSLGSKTFHINNYYNQIKKSKFVMCPSGMGWDTYRMWEAMYIGAIPVVEKYNRQDGWHKTMDDLPILWIDNFEHLNPSFLEKEYAKIVSRGAKGFKFEKLTMQYWEAFVRSFLPEGADLISTNNSLQKSQPSSISVETTDEEQEVPSKDANDGEQVSDQEEEPVQQENVALSYDHKMLKSLLSNHPEKLDICDTSELTFNETKMTGRIDPASFRIYNHTSMIAYGPKITKTGSTSAVNMLKSLFDISDNDKKLETKEEYGSLENYAFFAFVRHPMDRVLAGYHQMEIFWRMSWIGDQIDKFGLQWWNTSCLPKLEYSERDELHQCTGSEPRSDDITRLTRLNAFLDDIQRAGYFDQHIMPISYQISVSPLTTELSPDLQPTYFDLKSMDNVSDTLAYAVKGHTLSLGNKRHQMKRGSNDIMPWVVSWPDLTTIASKEDNTKEQALAQRIIKKMCKLYLKDIRCLPYDVPECDNYI